MSHRTAADIIRDTHNTSRFFVELPQIAWVLLIGTVIWGVYGYFTMPQRKDPEIPIKQALVITQWPGASAEKVEELVTRTVEKTIATNSNVARIESTSRSNVSTVTFTLADELRNVGPVLDDIGGRLQSIRDLPSGAGPVQYVRDFGDTATLMLTVASPKADAAELQLRAAAIRKTLDRSRPGGSRKRAGMIYCLPPAVDRRGLHLGLVQFANYVRSRGQVRDLREIEESGFLAIDVQSNLD